mmetsp:Transcript_21685/g.61706  ORF Transcript_21685/g.61706 Transcript_21685/m.61706 type:complete len:350 (+) Transcript_21685:59-1108(+)
MGAHGRSNSPDPMRPSDALMSVEFLISSLNALSASLCYATPPTSRSPYFSLSLSLCLWLSTHTHITSVTVRRSPLAHQSTCVRVGCRVERCVQCLPGVAFGEEAVQWLRAICPRHTAVGTLPDVDNVVDSEDVVARQLALVIHHTAPVEQLNNQLAVALCLHPVESECRLATKGGRVQQKTRREEFQLPEHLPRHESAQRGGKPPAFAARQHRVRTLVFVSAPIEPVECRHKGGQIPGVECSDSEEEHVDEGHKHGGQGGQRGSRPTGGRGWGTWVEFLYTRHHFKSGARHRGRELADALDALGGEDMEHPVEQVIGNGRRRPSRPRPTSARHGGHDGRVDQAQVVQLV